jgi:hypothetical protein
MDLAPNLKVCRASSVSLVEAENMSFSIGL